MVLLRRSLLLGTIVVALAGCNPITLDYATHRVTSRASGSVAPTTLVVDGSAVEAVDIVTRDCTGFRLTNVPGPRGPVTQDLPRARPTAVIRDRNDRVVFDDLYRGATEPGRAQVSYAADGDHLRIPVGSFAAPLTIQAGCTTFSGSAPGVGLTWYFDRCRTSNRTCSALTGGRLELQPAGWVWSH